MSFAQSIPPSGTEAFKNLDFYENNLKHESDIFLGNQLSNIIDITGQTDEDENKDKSDFFMINTTHPLHHVVQRFGDYGEKLFHGSPVCGHRLLGKFEVTFCAEINHIKTPRYSPILFDDWYSLRIYLMIRRPQTDTTYSPVPFKIMLETEDSTPVPEDYRIMTKSSHSFESPHLRPELQLDVKILATIPRYHDKKLRFRIKHMISPGDTTGTLPTPLTHPSLYIEDGISETFSVAKSFLTLSSLPEILYKKGQSSELRQIVVTLVPKRHIPHDIRLKTSLFHYDKQKEIIGEKVSDYILQSPNLTPHGTAHFQFEFNNINLIHGGTWVVLKVETKDPSDIFYGISTPLKLMSKLQKVSSITGKRLYSDCMRGAADSMIQPAPTSEGYLDHHLLVNQAETPLVLQDDAPSIALSDPGGVGPHISSISEIALSNCQDTFLSEDPDDSLLSTLAPLFSPLIVMKESQFESLKGEITETKRLYSLMIQELQTVRKELAEIKRAS